MNITELSQLRQFAAEISRQLKPGMIIGLVGELGTGKTTFVKELAKTYGIQDTVISPTFMYHQVYDFPEPSNGIKRLHHYDLYRLNTVTDLDELGIGLDDDEGIHLVEWIDHVPELRKQALQVLEFGLDTDGGRTVEERT